MSEMSNQNFENNGVNGTRPLGEVNRLMKKGNLPEDTNKECLENGEMRIV